MQRLKIFSMTTIESIAIIKIVLRIVRLVSFSLFIVLYLFLCLYSFKVKISKLHNLRLYRMYQKFPVLKFRRLEDALLCKWLLR